MMPMRKGLLSSAIHDAALFHTFLAHYVASYDLRYGSGDPEESLRHRMEAVRIVNERLADIPRALSDGTIATVANIAVYEVRTRTDRLHQRFLLRRAGREWIVGEHGRASERPGRNG